MGHAAKIITHVENNMVPSCGIYSINIREGFHCSRLMTPIEREIHLGERDYRGKKIVKLMPIILAATLGPDNPIA